MDVEVENPHPHVAHHHTGSHWLDKVLPISAILISVVSIWIAWHHGNVMQQLVHQNERLVQANSLPYVQMYSNSGENNFELIVSNQGVGPAEIRTAEMLVDNRPVADLVSFMRLCCGAPDRSGVSKSNLRGLMLRAGQQISFIQIQPGQRELVSRIAAAYNSKRLETRLCYCSVFGDCWQRSSKDVGLGIRPRPVAECKAPAVPYTD